jgi:hypothetical protein
MRKKEVRMSSDRVGDFLVGEMKEQKDYYNMFYEIYFERSQLYGTLIRFMLENDTKELYFTYDDLRHANDYILKFTPDKESETLKVEIIDNPDKEVKEDE